MAVTVLELAPSLAENGKRLVDAGELRALFQFIFDELFKLGSTDVVPSSTNIKPAAAEAPPPAHEPEPEPPTRTVTHTTTRRR